jgi:hypothetical protein
MKYRILRGGKIVKIVVRQDTPFCQWSNYRASSYTHNRYGDHPNSRKNVHAL